MILIVFLPLSSAPFTLFINYYFILFYFDTFFFIQYEIRSFNLFTYFYFFNYLQKPAFQVEKQISEQGRGKESPTHDNSGEFSLSVISLGSKGEDELLLLLPLLLLLWLLFCV